MREVTWSCIRRDDECRDRWVGLARVTEALEPVMVCGRSKRDAEELLAGALARLGARLPEFWSYVED